MKPLRLYLLALCLATLTCTASEAVGDSIAAAEHQHLWKRILQGVSGTPSAMVDRYTTSFSEIFADYALESANQAYLYQLGSRQYYGRIKADSYLHLSPNTTVWGEASYRNGKRKSVKWNSTADFLLLYPYVMADTLGGELNSERYTFNGGWAARFGRLDLGAQVDFRAEHEYRTYDPRPRSIVTDLAICVGAAYRLGGYRIGANVGGRFYKQTNNVKFFREAGVIPEYQMVGLGADYKRFSGSNTSAYYKATGITTGFDVRPHAASGLYISATYCYTPFNRILPNLNALPISFLYLQNLRSEAGWKQATGKNRMAVHIGIDYERRTGDEHIAGSSSSSEYRIIDVLTMYHAHNVNYYAGATFGQEAPQRNWTVDVQVGIADFNARYVVPERKMSFRKAYGIATAQLTWCLKRGQLLVGEVSAAYYANTESSILMPYATMDKNSTDLVNHTYANCTSSLMNAAASLRYDRKVGHDGRYGIFAAANSGISTGSNFQDFQLNLAVGLTF